MKVGALFAAPHFTKSISAFGFDSPRSHTHKKGRYEERKTKIRRI